MSITSIKPYFRTQLNTLGLTEWDDGFADDNIPSTLIDGAYFQFINSVTGVQLNNNHLEMSVNHEVRVYFKGFRDPATAIDESVLKCEDIIKAVANIVNQDGTDLKGVYLGNLTIEPLEADNNDNIIRAILTFDVRIFLCLDI